MKAVISNGLVVMVGKDIEKYSKDKEYIYIKNGLMKIKEPIGTLVLDIGEKDVLGWNYSDGEFTKGHDKQLEDNFDLFGLSISDEQVLNLIKKGEELSNVKK